MELKLLEKRLNKIDNERPIALYVDSETGIEYFVMNTSNCGAICPRLDSNGNPYRNSHHKRDRM